MSNVDQAHAYGRRGWRVIPLHHVTELGDCSCSAGPFCHGKGKHPIDKAWQNLASTSGADIEAWWEDRPQAGIGIATGAASGLWVFDVDGTDGVATLAALVDEHGPMPATRMVQTGSGGLHYYFTAPADFAVRNSSKWIGPGIDVRGEGGQVVAPPSVSGRGPYTLLRDADPAPAPDWLLDLVREHALNHDAGRSVSVKTAEPVDASFLPPEIRTLVSTVVAPDTGRYKVLHRIVACCREAGYTQGQTVTIVTPWCEAVGKFANRVPAEVARCWGKLDAAAERAEAWLPGSTRPTAGTAALDIRPTTDPAPTPSADGDETVDADGVDGDEAETRPPSWAPIDLSAILAGSYEPETPALLPRVDGHALLYPGRVHSLHGESESGKSLVAQAEVARILATDDDARVAYVDYEADEHAVTERLLALGAPAAAIAERLDYIRPETAPYALPDERRAWSDLLERPYAVAVLDGVTEALVMAGGATKDNDEITKWVRAVPRKIAERTGAAVVLIDHVGKDADARGRFAIGGQAKMAALDGAAFVVEVLEPIGRGMRGALSLRVAKDRPGGVRPKCGNYRASDRTQLAARVVIDSTDGKGIQVTVEAPKTTADDPAKAAAPFRPTVLMQRASMYLESLTEPASTKVVQAAVRGKESAVADALRVLVAEGFAAAGDGPHGGVYYSSTRPYREHDDALSESFTGWAEGASEQTSATSAQPPPNLRPAEDKTTSAPPPLPVGGAEVGGGRGNDLAGSTSAPDGGETR